MTITTAKLLTEWRFRSREAGQARVKASPVAQGRALSFFGTTSALRLESA